VQRANIILSVGIVAVVLLVALIVGGGVGVETVTRGVVIAPFYMAGFWVGGRLFAIAPAEIYRKVALWLLIATGLSVLFM
jgi:hypothetical protein